MFWEESDVLREALQFEVDVWRGRGRQEIHGKSKLRKKWNKASLKTEDAHDRTKWREGVQTIAMRNIRPPPLTGTKPN